MKKIGLFFYLIAILIAVHASQETNFTLNTVSKEETRIGGSLNFQTTISFYDTVTIDSLRFILPDNWSAFTNIDMNTAEYYPGDIITLTTTINYPKNNQYHYNL